MHNDEITGSTGGLGGTSLGGRGWKHVVFLIFCLLPNLPDELLGYQVNNKKKQG